MDTIEALQCLRYVQHRLLLVSILCSNLLRQELSPQAKGAVLFERADLYCKLQRFAEAKSDADAMLRMAPGYPSCYGIEGMALAGLNRYQEAVSSFSKGLDLKPNDGLFLIDRARVHLQFGFSSSAISDCSTVINRDRDQVGVYHLRAKAYMQRADYDAALRDLHRVLDLVKNDADSYSDYAVCLYFLGRSDEALDSVDRAAQLTTPVPAYQKCLISGFFTGVGDIKRALTFSDQAISLNPSDGACLNSRAILLLLTNDLDGAMAETEKAIKLWPHQLPPGSPEFHEEVSYINRGSIHLLHGDYELAKVDFEKAIAISPEKGFGYCLLALASGLKGDMPGALLTVERGLKRCSDSDDKAELACWYVLCGGSLAKDINESLLQYSSELWPYPLVQYYLGRIKAEDVLVPARRPTTDCGGENLCDAYFYIGAKLLVDHQPEKAKEYFVKAAEYGPLYWPFRQLARKQLPGNCLAPLVQGGK